MKQTELDAATAAVLKTVDGFINQEMASADWMEKAAEGKIRELTSAWIPQIVYDALEAAEKVRRAEADKK